jgi:DNA processing protein
MAIDSASGPEAPHLALVAPRPDRSISVEPDERPIGDLPAEAWVTALSSLEGMGPRRLRALLDHYPDEHQAWQAVAAGRAQAVPEVGEAMGSKRRTVGESWVRQARALDVARFWRGHATAGIGVMLRGRPAYPDLFEDDLEPPTILFHQGDPDVVVGPRVAIVGTRDCTRYGHEIAFELGRDLSSAGVAIVSGLALGIDSAAHAGAIAADAAPPIAVVGSGLDVVYPRRNGPLWREVARRGVVWSEYPMGSSPAPWHFPARNRLIAAVADVVVVVESHASGGALLTADEALERSRPVMAVPGPVRNPSSQGTNELLAAGGGASVARDATDVLVALGMASGSRRTSIERRPRPTEADQLVLDAIGWQPATLDHVVLRMGRSVPELAASLARLEHDGWVEPRGGWFERVAKSGGHP